MSDHLWTGLRNAAQHTLETRDYDTQSTGKRLGATGVEVSALLSSQDQLLDHWIPGVEFFHRKVFHQRHRGTFAEFARRDEGKLKEIGLWPAQWATARMYAGTAKGFHIHPPHIPEGESPEKWFQKLFGSKEAHYEHRPYDHEQWDVMFFVQGIVEMILVDERAGMDRRIMRFFIEGDDLPGPNNAGVVIPAGVAHALRGADSKDLMMVYGTSTSFAPEFEGRIASDVESAPLPTEWAQYIDPKMPL